MKDNLIYNLIELDMNDKSTPYQCLKCVNFGYERPECDDCNPETELKHFKAREETVFNIQTGNGIAIIGNRVWIDGVELPPVPSKRKYYSSAQIDGKVYINGYEFKKGKWRRTLTALWHMWF